MTDSGNSRPRRADAERNLGALLEAARKVFTTSGVDAPAKEITDAAGLGVGTLYRHFPRRSDLILAVLHHEIDASAQAVAQLRADHGPQETLHLWADRYVDLVATKRGLAEALHSEDEAFTGVHEYVLETLEPVVRELLTDGRAAGELGDGLGARELLYAIGLLCHPVPGGDDEINRRMIQVLLRGLRPQRPSSAG